MALDSAQGVEDAISRYSAALDQEIFLEKLDRLVLSEWHWGTRQELHVRALKCHRHRRCVFDITVKTESGWHSVIGKVYAKDRADIFQAMDAFQRAGFGPEAEFSIPQPFLYLSSLGILLVEKVEGPSAKDILLSGTLDEQLIASEKCGEWLGRFHTGTPGIGKVNEPADQFSRYQRWTDKIACFGEPFASKAEMLFEMLKAGAPAPGAIEYCAGHGSYLPEHVILGGRRTTTIDLDEYDVADPNRDLAWFVVCLMRLGLRNSGSLHALDVAIEKFLGAYIYSRRTDVTARLPFYIALECLHRARRELVGQTPCSRERAEILLDEGLHVLGV
jgi:aminoglycoside phosphotransferase (APT) family kinase protein